jgi:HD-like signal output (HDOD) protein
VAPDAGPPMLVHRLLLELERLPPSRAAALRVMQLVDDPEVGAADVASAASLDAVLTARVLRMANSAYYGLSGRVASVPFAVSVIGLQTVRSLAAAAAGGLSAETDLPPRFSSRGAATAAAAALLAPRVGAEVSRAFCAGIVHDLGTALLWRHDNARQRAILTRATASEPAHVRELQEYGTTHAALGGEVLTSWHFPEDLCLAIAGHHAAPSAGAAPLRRALQGGIALSSLIHQDRAARRPDGFVLASLEAAGVEVGEREALVVQVRRESAELIRALRG